MLYDQALMDTSSRVALLSRHQAVPLQPGVDHYLPGVVRGGWALQQLAFRRHRARQRLAHQALLASRQRFDYTKPVKAKPVKVSIDRSEINCKFSITGSARKWEVVLEGRGGPTSNLDYADGLEEIFRRFASIRGELEGAELATGPAQDLADDERQLQIKSGYPVKLRDVKPEKLRLELGRAQKALPKSKNRKSWGDGSNKMLLRFKLPRDYASDKGLIDRIQRGPVDEDATAVYANPESRDAVRRPGQGFMADPVLKKKIEDHAMRMAQQEYEVEGWEVRDVSAAESYDLLVTRSGEARYVEVKGTTGDGAMVLVTRGSVNTALTERRTDLFVVSRIAIRGNEAVGGRSAPSLRLATKSRKPEPNQVRALAR